MSIKIAPIPESAKLNEAIDNVLAAMSSVECGSGEYAKLAGQLSTLTKIKEILNNIELKRVETALKEEEAEKNQSLKQAELRIKQAAHEADLLNRNAETTQKIRESEATTRLRDAETHLKEMDARTHDHVKKETLALIAANLIGIVFILGYERAGVITSKALGFVTRLR